MTTVTHPKDVALRMAGLSKSFGPTRALDGAELAVLRGTVHALLGGNGSGKSTAIKILAGVYHADAGWIEVGGTSRDAVGWSALDARQAGIRFVHQDLGLFDQLSVVENFALDAGYPTGPSGRVMWRRLHDRVAGLLEKFEIDADPRLPVGALRPAQRTMVAIARALQDDTGEAVLVLDEPTATLPAHESRVLLRAIRRRADLGQTIVMVSHRMAEVLSVAHDFTVFRDGRTVATLTEEDGTAPTEDELIALMTGRRLGTALANDTSHQARQRLQARDAALEVRGLSGGPLRGVDLVVSPGEIVGVTGLVGSGRTSLLKTVFGEHRPASGSVAIAGRRQTGREDVCTRMAQGIAYVAEDRLGESSFSTLTLRENLSASVLRHFWRARGMAVGEERRTAAELVDRYAVKTAGVESFFSSLSGGNQQKAILARWLRREPTVLLLDEPTQGVDVMSRADIYDTVRRTAARGCAVVVASSDFVELSTLCDRVVVLADGVVHTERRGEQLTPDHLTAATQSSATATPGGDS